MFELQVCAGTHASCFACKCSCLQHRAYMQNMAISSLHVVQSAILDGKSRSLIQTRPSAAHSARVHPQLLQTGASVDVLKDGPVHPIQQLNKQQAELSESDAGMRKQACSSEAVAASVRAIADGQSGSLAVQDRLTASTQQAPLPDAASHQHSDSIGAPAAQDTAMSSMQPQTLMQTELTGPMTEVNWHASQQLVSAHH